MKAANYKKSPRLQKLLQVMRDGEERSTYQLMMATGSVAVSTNISELRAQGAQIACRVERRNGKRVWLYTLQREPSADVAS